MAALNAWFKDCFEDIKYDGKFRAMDITDSAAKAAMREAFMLKAMERNGVKGSIASKAFADLHTSALTEQREALSHMSGISDEASDDEVAAPEPVRVEAAKPVAAPEPLRAPAAKPVAAPVPRQNVVTTKLVDMLFKAQDVDSIKARSCPRYNGKVLTCQQFSAIILQSQRMTRIDLDTKNAIIAKHAAVVQAFQDPRNSSVYDAFRRTFAMEDGKTSVYKMNSVLTKTTRFLMCSIEEGVNMLISSKVDAKKVLAELANAPDSDLPHMEDLSAELMSTEGHRKCLAYYLLVRSAGLA